MVIERIASIMASMKSLLRRILIIVIMVLASSGVARASSTEIRARVAAVRIIVVNGDNRITHIYQNTDQAVVPEVRRTTPNGQILAYTPVIKQQYQAYHQELPSLIETLYAML